MAFYILGILFIFLLYIVKKVNKDGYDYRTKFIHMDFGYELNNKNSDVTRYYLMSEDGEKCVDNIEIVTIHSQKY